MAFKFFNVGKANEEITRLETELATSQAALTTAGENAALVEARAVQLSADLGTAQQTIGTLSTDLVTRNTELGTARAELVTANARLANPTAQVTAQASVRASEIAAGQGIPAVVIATVATPAAGVPVTELKGRARTLAAWKNTTE